jgi:ubiquinone/menaquinone biosynthesis C-methylase UbiE
MDAGTYHALELKIARDPVDSRRVMPTIMPRHRRILDVGCGAGQTLIASALGAGVEAVGVDTDPAALELGRRIDPRIRFVRSRGELLPLPSAHFDLVISRVALPYMHNRVALSEMGRVLKPGGDAWFTLHPLSQVLREMGENLGRADLRSALHRVYVIANGILAHFTGREIPSPKSGRYESFQTEGGIRRQLRRAGFEGIHIDKRNFFVVSAAKALVPRE